jgi:predicted naringenin-chalcone synthase
MSFIIHSIATAAPGEPYSQEEIARCAAIASCAGNDKDAASLQKLFRNTRIESRYFVHGRPLVEAQRRGELVGPVAGPSTAVRMAEYVREALPLALTATRAALVGIDPATITHVVTVSCTGFAAPGVDVGLIRDLPLSPAVSRTHIGFMGCHGALNALRVAKAYAESDPAARVLICCVELCSVHFHYPWNPERMTGNALFADGAAAVVGAAGDVEDGWKLTANGSFIFPGTEDAMGWTIGDAGFDMHLSTRVPVLIADNLGGWLDGWLAEHDLKRDDVGSWAIHPGGPRILAAVEGSIGLLPGTCVASRDILTRYGNMSSPTILFILDELRRRNAPRPCVALGFGPGLAVEAALFQ